MKEAEDVDWRVVESQDVTPLLVAMLFVGTMIFLLSLWYLDARRGGTRAAPADPAPRQQRAL